MNKKLACASLALLLFAGCSSSASTDSSTADSSSAASSETTTEKATVTADDNAEVTAEVTKTDGKVTGISIDEVTADGVSKKDAGSDYGMVKASSIGKEWNEQVEYLENYMIENGIDSVKLNDEGYAENEDLKSGCTINLTNIMKAVDEANAK